MLSISEDGFGLYIYSKVTGKCEATFFASFTKGFYEFDLLLVQIRAILKIEVVLLGGKIYTPPTIPELDSSDAQKQDECAFCNGL